MGWTSVHKPSHMTSLEFLTNEFRGTVVANAMVGFTEAYFAIRDPESDEIYAVIVTMHHTPNAKDGFNFTYRSDSETMGPLSDRCPEKILRLLSPTTNQYALQWRQRCLTYHATRRAKLARARPVPGNILRFSTALTFTDGSGPFDTFLYAPSPRYGRKPRDTFIPIRWTDSTRWKDGHIITVSGWERATYSVVTIRNWKTREWDIVATDMATLAPPPRSPRPRPPWSRPMPHPSSARRDDTENGFLDICRRSELESSYNTIHSPDLHTRKETSS